MIEITITKEGEVKIKVDTQAQSVSVSRSEAENVIHNLFRSQVPYISQSDFEDLKKAKDQYEINEAIKRGEIKCSRIVPPEDCKRQNICGYEPKPGCKSGEIEGGPAY